MLQLSRLRLKRTNSGPVDNLEAIPHKHFFTLFDGKTLYTFGGGEEMSIIVPAMSTSAFSKIKRAANTWSDRWRGNQRDRWKGPTIHVCMPQAQRDDPMPCSRSTQIFADQTSAKPILLSIYKRCSNPQHISGTNGNLSEHTSSTLHEEYVMGSRVGCTDNESVCRRQRARA